MVFVKLVGKEVQLILALGIFAIFFCHMLEFLTGVQNPIVIARSDFKECNITSGDALFIHRKNMAINVGDVVLSKVYGFKRPSFHRVIGVYNHLAPESTWFLTQGETHVAWPFYTNNNQLWLQQHHIIGRVFWSLPDVGRFLDFEILKGHMLYYSVITSVTVSIYLVYLVTKLRDLLTST